MNLSAFLAENAIAVENVKFAASKRFMGEDNKPILWEIKTITGTEDEALLKTMLTPGEYADYVQKVQEVCGFDTTLQDEVDEAKN